MIKLLEHRYIRIFLLTLFLAGFLLYFQPCFANDVELSSQEANALLHSAQQGIMNARIDLPDLPEKTADLYLIRNSIQQKELNFVFIELPKQFLIKLVKTGVTLCVSPDGGAIIKQIEKISVDQAIKIAKDWLFQNQIKISSGRLKDSFVSYKGDKQNVIFYYNMAYHSINNSKGNLMIEFYSPNEIEPEKPKGSNIIGLKVSCWDFKAWRNAGNEKLQPFTMRIHGIVSKVNAGAYSWDQDLGIEISYTEPFPEFPHYEDPRGFWQKLKFALISGAKKEVKETINSFQGIFDILGEVKKRFSGINPFSAGIVDYDVVLAPKSGARPALDDEIVEPVASSFAFAEVTEDKPLNNNVGDVSGVGHQSLSQIQLEDIAKQIALIREQIEELNRNNKTNRTNEIDKVEEIEKPKELEKPEIQEIQWCEGSPNETTTKNQVIFNEIAWMGTKNSSYDEYIELKNISNSDINLQGWQILDKASQIKIIFTKDHIIPKNGFYLLERTDDESVPNIPADFIYKGALSDKNEEIYVFDSKCVLQDKAIASPEWPAGNKSERRTMERMKNFDWQTYAGAGKNNVFGTPKQENSKPESQPKSEYNGFTSSSSSSSASASTASSFVFASGGDTQNPIAVAGPDISAVINQRICFDASQSYDNIKITSYKWDIDTNNSIDWNNPDLTGKKPCITGGYSEPGNYTITLRTQDSAKNTGIDSLNVNVSLPIELLITEIQIEAENKSQDFIELYNPHNQDIDISKYQLKKKNQTGTESSIKVFPDNSVIRAKNYFVWAKTDYSDIIPCDISSSSYITDNNSIVLLDRYKNVIDELAWGTGEIENPKTLNITDEVIYHQSLGRKIADGIYQNTGDNSQDFEIQNPTPKQQNHVFSHYLSGDEIFEQYVAPDTEITSKPDILTNQNSAIFEFSSDKQNCVFEYKEYRCPTPVNMDWEKCEQNLVLQDLCEGEHIIYVRAIDLAGNIDATPAEYQWGIDTIAPTTEILSYPQVITNQLQASFTFQTDENASFECKLNDAESQNCSSPYTIIDLYEGEQIFSIQAFDLAGNTQDIPTQYQWTIDTTITNPLLLLQDLDTDSRFYTNNTQIKIIISDNPDVFYWFLSEAQTEQPMQDSEQWQDEKPDLFALSPGNEIKIVYLWTKDEAGNISEYYSSATITLDTIAPNIEITSKPDILTNQNIAIFEFSSDKQNCALEYRCPTPVNTDWESCEQNLTLQDLCEGEHIIEARATDLYGNISDTAKYEWVIDITPPLPSFQEISEIQEQISFLISWSADDANAQFQLTYFDDDENYAYFPSENEYTTEKQYSFSGEDETIYYFQLKAIDIAGNESGYREMSTFISIPKPILEITIAKLEFAATEFGANPDTQILLIGNIGNVDLEYTANIETDTDTNYIAIAPVSDTIAPAHSAEILVSADIPGLCSGDYSSDILISSNAGNKEIPVLLNIEGDTHAPAQISDLLAETGNEPKEIKLSWTSPLDNDLLGRAIEYEIRYSLSAITEENWNLAQEFPNAIVPNTASTKEILIIPDLEFDITYYFAIQSKDQTRNLSLVSNSCGSEPLNPMKILISEIQIEADEKTHDFIELYNPNSAEVNLKNYRLVKRAQTSETDYSIKSWSAESNPKIPAQEYYLWVSSDDENFALLTDADASTSQTISNKNGIAIRYGEENTGKIVDAVGWEGFDNVLFEWQSFPDKPKRNQTIGRKWNSEYQDTDDNSLDFELQNPTPKEQNQTYVEFVCDSEHLDLCLAQNDCEGVGGYWYNNVCNIEPEPAPEPDPINVWLNELDPQDEYISTKINFVLKWEALNPELNNYTVEYQESDGSPSSGDWQGFYPEGTDTEKEFISETDFTNYYFKVSAKNQDNTLSEEKQIQVLIASLPVSINEVMYYPEGNKDNYCEYIELYNNTEKNIDLQDWILSIWGNGSSNLEIVADTDNSGDSLIIKSHGFAIIGGDVKEKKNIYSDSCEYIIPDYSEDVIRLKTNNQSLNLANTGQGSIEIKDLQEQSIDYILYDNTWGGAGDGNSIQKSRPDSFSSIKENWTGELPTLGAQNTNYDTGSYNYLSGVQTNNCQIWSKQLSPYFVKADYQVPVNKTLLIEPGVQVYFKPGEYGGKLTIEGTLKAIGEQNNEILFTSSVANEFWYGISFRQTSQNSELIWVKISGAGISYASSDTYYEFDEGQAIHIEDTDDVALKNLVIQRNRYSGIVLKNSNSEIDNVEILMLGQETPLTKSAGIYVYQGSPQIRNSHIKGNLDIISGYGIYMKGGASPIIEQNIFENYNIPVYVENSYPAFSENQAINNTYNSVFVSGSLFADIIIWEIPGENMDYVIDGSVWVTEGSILTINPGNVIKFKSGSGVNEKANLFVDGIMSAIGKPEQQIIFTSILDDEENPSEFLAPGNWGTIIFSASGSILDNVVVKYGGIGDGAYKRGAILIKDSIFISDSIIENNKAAGVQLELDNDVNVEFDNVVFRNHNVNWGNHPYPKPSTAIYIEGNFSNPSFNNCVFIDNTKNVYWLNSAGKCEALLGITPPIECSEEIW